MGQWRSIEASRYMLSVIQFLLYLPLFTTPGSVKIKNNKSVIVNERFVSSKIEKLVRKGCVQ